MHPERSSSLRVWTSYRVGWFLFYVIFHLRSCNLHLNLFLYSSTSSCHWHTEDISLWPAVSVLAPPSGLGPGLAFLCWIPATLRSNRSDMGRHKVSQCRCIVAASRRSERYHSCDWPTADGQRVRAQGERMQQGRLRRIQWRGLPPHSPCTWWDVSRLQHSFMLYLYSSPLDEVIVLSLRVQ